MVWTVNHFQMFKPGSVHLTVVLDSTSMVWQVGGRQGLPYAFLSRHGGSVDWFNWQMWGAANSNKSTNQKHQDSIKLYKMASTGNSKRSHGAPQNMQGNKMYIIQHIAWASYRKIQM